MSAPQDPTPEVTLSKPLAVDRESKRAPSMVLSMIFTAGLAAIVFPLVGFVGSIALGSQRGLNASVFLLKWAFIGVGLLLAYGASVGIYHTFLAMTGLDRGRRR
ncbi:MAG TPA: hypothetical protein VMV18_00355 [bacterium]|nr:hypothetical protein [bacterium]